MHIKVKLTLLLVVVTAALAASFLGGWHWHHATGAPTAGWAWEPDSNADFVST